MEEAPFGWPQRQKRSLARMQGNDRPASPGWSFTNVHQPHEQPLHSHPPQPNVLEYQPDLVYRHDRDLNSHFDPSHNASNFQARIPTPYPDSAGASPPLENAPHLPQVAGMAAQTPRRFAGDGLDFRRPAGPRSLHIDQQQQEEQEVEDDDDEGRIMVDLSGPENDSVIDLTADDSGDSGYSASQDSNDSARVNRSHNAAPRLPHSGRHIIIDLTTGHESYSEFTPASIDLDSTSARPVELHQRRPSGVRNRDADEVQFVREQAIPEEELQRRSNRGLDHALNLLGVMNGEFNHLRQQVNRFNEQLNADAAGRAGRGPIAPPRVRGSRRVGAFLAPTLDFGIIGFDMVEMGGARAAGPQPPPTYDIPPKAPDGFTRSPVEADVLACPNCGDELCVGRDDAKKQVWIVKGCGHVYCGECTANRAAKKSTKGKERPPNTSPFKVCVVEDCGKSVVNRKSMIQIFL